ncbi:Pentatricopeptide repeat-containing protein [Thalictrum thalictroides]|uniref:Pentatricopeptide repeat-containing protein n=1 Tax=Thalictrum thalictroides TaxID=46969 RepID=A0A7J6VJR8_THATH|nr:Pentatricopeptide repeat-containing protein [Thalictrum thalictroides]
MVIGNTKDWSFSSISSCIEISNKIFNGSSKILSFHSVTRSSFLSFAVNSPGFQLPPLLLEEDALKELQTIEIDKRFSDVQLRSENKENLNDFICGLCKDRSTEPLAFKYYQKAKDQPDFRPSKLTIKLLIRYLLRCRKWSSISLLSKDFNDFSVFPNNSTCSRLISSCIKARKFKMTDSLLGIFETEEKIAVSAFESAMNGYNKLHMYSSTVAVFHRMKSAGVHPDADCYCRIMEAYSKIGDTDKVVSLFNEFRSKDFETLPSFTQIFGILCDSLGKSGRAFEALELYREMTGKGIVENSSIYSSLICSFASIREVKLAEQLFHEAKEKKMVKDPALFLKLILMYVEEGSIEKTLEIVQAMKGMNIKATDCIFCAVINGYCKQRGPTETIKVYEDLVSSSYEPGQVTYASIINVYCRLGLYDKAEKVFSEMEAKGFVRCVVAYSSMVSMYGKVGRLKDAMKLVAKMKERGCEPNVWVYNSLMDMHGRANNLRQVEKLWKEMKRRKIAPDKVSYTSIIKAYNKAREFDACLRYYQEFRSNGGTIDRAMAGIMVGVFSKGSRIDELVKLLQDMKSERMVLDVRLYKSALNALRDAGLEFQAKWFEQSFASANVLSMRSERVRVRPIPNTVS